MGMKWHLALRIRWGNLWSYPHSMAVLVFLTSLPLQCSLASPTIPHHERMTKDMVSVWESLRPFKQLSECLGVCAFWKQVIWIPHLDVLQLFLLTCGVLPSPPSVSAIVWLCQSLPFIARVVRPKYTVYLWGVSPDHGMGVFLWALPRWCLSIYMVQVLPVTHFSGSVGAGPYIMHLYVHLPGPLVDIGWVILKPCYFRQVTATTRLRFSSVQCRFLF